MIDANISSKTLNPSPQVIPYHHHLQASAKHGLPVEDPFMFYLAQPTSGLSHLTAFRTRLGKHVDLGTMSALHGSGQNFPAKYYFFGLPDGKTFAQGIMRCKMSPIKGTIDSSFPPLFFFINLFSFRPYFSHPQKYYCFFFFFVNIYSFLQLYFVDKYFFHPPLTLI